jgi:hypothetical protein
LGYFSNAIGAGRVIGLCEETLDPMGIAYRLNFPRIGCHNHTLCARAFCLLGNANHHGLACDIRQGFAGKASGS